MTSPAMGVVLSQRRPGDAARSGIGAHRKAALDLERLQINHHHAVIVPQAKVRARSVWHYEHSAIARIARSDLESLELFARGRIKDDQRAGAAVKDEDLAVRRELQAVGVG